MNNECKKINIKQDELVLVSLCPACWNIVSAARQKQTRTLPTDAARISQDWSSDQDFLQRSNLVLMGSWPRSFILTILCNLFLFLRLSDLDRDFFATEVVQTEQVR